MSVFILSVIKALVGWAILMLIGTNLIGFVVRGLVRNSDVDALEKSGYASLRQEAAKLKRASAAVNIFFIVLTLLYFFLLLRWWNIGVLSAAIMLMASRVPDLLWEIRTGQKISKSNKPAGSIYLIAGYFNWLALPVLWWAIYSR